jgi:hypothetical protein
MSTSDLSASKELKQDVEKDSQEIVRVHTKVEAVVQPSKLSWSFTVVAFIVTALLYGK